MSVYQTSSFALSILLAYCAVVHCVAAQRSASTVYITISNQYLSNSSLINFRQSSAVSVGEAISTTNSALTISEASFSDNNARSGDDVIREVTVESSDGLLSRSMDGQYFRYTDSGVSSYEMNWPLFLFMTIMLLLVNIKYCINCVGYTLGFIVYCCIVIIVVYVDNDSDILMMINNT